jgi:hypothetical protein
MECLRRLQSVHAGIGALRKDLCERGDTEAIQAAQLLQHVEKQLDGRSLEYISLHLREVLVSLEKVTRNYTPRVSRISTMEVRSLHEWIEEYKDRIQEIVHETWRENDQSR